ncbi:endonuclease [Candidatus Marsarchaeota archaeon]|nr:endonuclease [Candidatus Marsarchaeota archaeon]
MIDQKACYKKPDALNLNLIYNEMKSHFGFLNWWPGDTKLEIVLGAILTQQTSWKNVEKAINKMKQNNAMDFDYISACDLKNLEKRINNVSFYKQKARYIKNIFQFIKTRYGSLENLFKLDKKELRKTLLSMNGIGNETADSIILYAANKKKFVIDAYTKRVMHRIFGIDKNIKYEKLQEYFENNLKNNLSLYKDFHAQFVELGKNYCRTKPFCINCPLNKMCKKSNIF